GNYIPTARPGHRAPHAALADGQSTLDLYGRAYTLLIFGANANAALPLVEAAKRRGVPISVVVMAEPHIAALYQRTFVLVRPDGHVAWRDDRMPEDALRLVDVVRGAAAVPDRIAEKPAVQAANISSRL
ncbi:MAG: monooxygenase, partial [Xanthobacteraceae bacterium]